MAEQNPTRLYVPESDREAGAFSAYTVCLYEAIKGEVEAMETLTTPRIAAQALAAIADDWCSSVVETELEDAEAGEVE